MDEAGAVYFQETFESKLHNSPQMARSSVSTMLMHRYNINTNRNSREKDSATDTVFDRHTSPLANINFKQNTSINEVLLTKKKVPALELKKVAALQNNKVTRNNAQTGMTRTDSNESNIVGSYLMMNADSLDAI